MNPDFSGRWRFNLEKSILLGRAPSGGDVFIEHRDPHFTQTLSSVNSDGAQVEIVFRGVTTGEEFHNLMLGSDMRSRASWQGIELKIESWIQLGGRQAHFCDYWSLSPDGNTLVMEHRGDDLAGQRAVLERVPDAALNMPS